MPDDTWAAYPGPYRGSRGRVFPALPRLQRGNSAPWSCSWQGPIRKSSAEAVRPANSNCPFLNTVASSKTAFPVVHPAKRCSEPELPYAVLPGQPAENLSGRFLQRPGTSKGEVSRFLEWFYEPDRQSKARRKAWFHFRRNGFQSLQDCFHLCKLPWRLPCP